MLNALNVTRQCLLRLVIRNCLKKYTQIWKKVENLLNIKFDSDPVCGDNDKYIKTKMKVYDNNNL